MRERGGKVKAMPIERTDRETLHCATAMVAAQQLGRYWIGIDIEAKASELVVARLSNEAGMFSDFIHRLDIPIRTDVKIEDFQDTKNKKKIKARLAKEFGGICNACSLDNYASYENKRPTKQELNTNWKLEKNDE